MTNEEIALELVKDWNKYKDGHYPNILTHMIEKELFKKDKEHLVSLEEYLKKESKITQLLERRVLMVKESNPENKLWSKIKVTREWFNSDNDKL